MWISIDPLRAEVVPYPTAQADLLESAFQTRTPGVDGEVYLGLSFHGATVHLPQHGKRFYQTTPGGYHPFQKPPGYRSVLRLSGPFPMQVGVRRIHGEWRSCDDGAEAERLLFVKG